VCYFSLGTAKGGRDHVENPHPSIGKPVTVLLPKGGSLGKYMGMAAWAPSQFRFGAWLGAAMGDLVAFAADNFSGLISTEICHRLVGEDNGVLRIDDQNRVSQTVEYFKLFKTH